MKFLLSTLLVCLVAINVQAIKIDDVQDFWKAVEDILKSIVSKQKLHPDTGLNISQYLAKYNYPLECHDVTTEDGYILTLHRIPHGRNEVIKENGSRPAILLSHCLACSSMDWIWQGPNTSLALLLADMGYDVWLTNTRGNSNSMRHQTLSTANASFWDFSFHEKGYYDMAASIDYVLNETNLEKLTYVGHSQGTSGGLVLTSSRPEYNDKLNLMVLLSPIAYLEHSNSPFVNMIADYKSIIKLVLGLLNIHGVTHNSYLSLITDIICNDSSPLQDLCIIIIDTFAGYDADQVDRSLLTVFLSNTPNGISFKDIDHYTQELKSGAFRRYDYGNSITNYFHYGTSEPPSYDLKQIKVPLAVYYAKNDFLSTIPDVERLLSEVDTDIVDKYLIEFEHFNHLDFITAKDVKTMLYDRVLSVIKQKNPATRN